MTTLEIIQQIIAEKQVNKIVPCHALRIEILERCTIPYADVEDEISEMLDLGMIISHPTIRDTAFEITDNN